VARRGRGRRLIVLDTHAWLWWETDRQKLSDAARRAVEAADGVGVCTVSVLELAAIEARGRGRLRLPLRRWVTEVLARDGVRSLPLTASVALDAAQLGFVGDPFDRIIYATARAEDAQLVTRDERMHEFDPERAVW
jgi:PIN domain nuclease of toxin-antitoxin system